MICFGAGIRGAILMELRSKGEVHGEQYMWQLRELQTETR